jgi:hypothetical protein
MVTGVDLAGSIFNADRGYDGDKNFQSIFGMDVMIDFRGLKARSVSCIN